MRRFDLTAAWWMYDRGLRRASHWSLCKAGQFTQGLSSMVDSEGANSSHTMPGSIDTIGAEQNNAICSVRTSYFNPRLQTPGQLFDARFGGRAKGLFCPRFTHRLLSCEPACHFRRVRFPLEPLRGRFDLTRAATATASVDSKLLQCNRYSCEPCSPSVQILRDKDPSSELRDGTNHVTASTQHTLRPNRRADRRKLNARY